MFKTMISDIDVRLVYRHNVPCLVAAFRHSAEPVTWHVVLDKEPCFSLELRAEGDHTVLALRRGGHDLASARFIARTDAEQAFDAVQRKMMAAGASQEGMMRWILLVAGIVLLAMMWGGHTTSTDITSSRRAEKIGAAEIKDKDDDKPATFQKGVPMPADQFLVPPSED